MWISKKKLADILEAREAGVLRSVGFRVAELRQEAYTLHREALSLIDRRTRLDDDLWVSHVLQAVMDHFKLNASYAPGKLVVSENGGPEKP